MKSTDAKTVGPKGKFRWFRFSLRGLLLFVLALAVWLGYVSDRAHRQRKTVEILTEMQAGVFYDDDLTDEVQVYVTTSGGMYRDATGRQWWHSYEVDPRGPKWLRDLIGEHYFHTVVAVQLTGDIAPGITGQHVRQIGELRYLTRLSLDYTGDLTDSDLEPLRRLKRLERLFLERTQITDATLQNLAHLTELRYLSLAGTRITDQGLVHLQRFTHLEMLQLSRTNISDAGLSTLRPLKNLKIIYLDGTLVTEQGARELQELLPGCAVALWPPGIVG